MESVNNYRSHIGQQNIHSDVINILLPAKIPKFLNPNNVLIPDEFIPRDKELEEIEERLNSQNRPLLLINGEGGLGKTTTAYAYWKKNIDKYNHLAYLSGQGNLTTSFGNIFHHLPFEIKAPASIVSHFDVTFQFLQNLPKNCLLLIDNANDHSDLSEFLQKVRGLNWHIIITSRCSGICDNEYIIEHLPPQDAKKLFKQFYDEGSSDFEILLDQFLVFINYNTLVLELYSKFLREASETGETLRSVFDKLRSREIVIDGEGIDLNIPWSEQASYSGDKKLDSILDALYDFNLLDTDSKRLLDNLSLLGISTISLDDLKQILVSYGVTELRNLLSLLNKRGWISSVGSGKGKRYKLSPVVRLLTLSKANFDISDIELLSKQLAKLLDFEPYSIDFKDKSQWMSLATSFIQNVPTNACHLTLLLYGRMAKVYRELGGESNLFSAKDLLTKSIKIGSEYYGEEMGLVKGAETVLANVLKDFRDAKNLNHAKEILEKVLSWSLKETGDQTKEIAIIQSDLAGVLEKIGGITNLLRSKSLLEKSLEINTSLFGGEAVEVAVNQSNLAGTLLSLGGRQNLLKAKSLLISSLKINKRIYGENSPILSTNRSNLAIVLQYLGGRKNLKEAKRLLKLVLESDIELFGEKSPRVEIDQSNLAMVLKEIGGPANLNEAKSLILKSLNICNEIYSVTSSSVSEGKSRLAMILKDLGSDDSLLEAKALLESSIDIDIKNYGENSINVATKKTNLAIVLMALNDNDQLLIAADLAKDAFRINSGNLGSEHSNSFWVYDVGLKIYCKLFNRPYEQIFKERVIPPDFNIWFINQSN